MYAGTLPHTLLTLEHVRHSLRCDILNQADERLQIMPNPLIHIKILALIV